MPIFIKIMITFVAEMRIVLDDKIPYIRDVISKITDDVVYIKGSDISADDVKDADALIIRTRTVCNKKLLDNSKVKFVATATIGFDHIDTEYMKQAGIKWINCPGCNAGSVAQYICSVLLLLIRNKGIKPESSVIGIVGYGHVGKKIKAVADNLGFKVLVNDPPLEDNGAEGHFVSLDEIEQKCDIITFHVPFIKDGRYKTFHLADNVFFKSLVKKPFIINTSRGVVVDNDELLSAINEGTIKDAVIDTWENEPNISLSLLKKVYIGTPHIAGYSADGKVNADNMVIKALCNYFKIDDNFKITPPSLPDNYLSDVSGDDKTLKLYNPLIDSEKLKSNPDKFEDLRGNYPLRREFY